MEFEAKLVLVFQDRYVSHEGSPERGPPSAKKQARAIAMTTVPALVLAAAVLGPLLVAANPLGISHWDLEGANE